MSRRILNYAVYFFSLAFALILPSPIDVEVTEVGGLTSFLVLGVDRSAATPSRQPSQARRVPKNYMLTGVNPRGWDINSISTVDLTGI